MTASRLVAPALNSSHHATTGFGRCRRMPATIEASPIRTMRAITGAVIDSGTTIATTPSTSWTASSHHATLVSRRPRDGGGGPATGEVCAAGARGASTDMVLLPAGNAINGNNYITAVGVLMVKCRVSKTRRYLQGHARGREPGVASARAGEDPRQAVRGRGWHRGQEYEERLANGSRRIAAPQRRHGSPSRPYTSSDRSNQPLSPFTLTYSAPNDVPPALMASVSPSRTRPSTRRAAAAASAAPRACPSGRGRRRRS